MRDEYELEGPTQSITVEIEEAVAAELVKMCDHTKLSESELMNTALKRFVASHSDFLPERGSEEAS